MGQEASMPIDPSTPPITLSARTLLAVAEYITSGNVQKIVVMTGAGISTSAGIPDFRSPETGLYANLSRLNLPYAEAVFTLSYFEEHPEAFYTLAQELYPGKWRPTITHMFIALLHKKELLFKHFTQNIDCLDREAGVPGDMVIEAHGSFATSRCIQCKLEYPSEEMLEHVQKKEIPRCKTCNGLVKPDIVFFGEKLPAAFLEGMDHYPPRADLVIVMGSSLSVHPFAELPSYASNGVPRLLINMEAVGDFGCRADDVLELGDCDTGVRKLAEACGWLEELEKMWEENGRKFGIEPVSKQEKVERSKDEMLEDEVLKITKEVEETLNVTQKHTEKVMATSTPTVLPSKPTELFHGKNLYGETGFRANNNQTVRDAAVAKAEGAAEKAEFSLNGRYMSEDEWQKDFRTNHKQKTTATAEREGAAEKSELESNVRHMSEEEWGAEFQGNHNLKIENATSAERETDAEKPELASNVCFKSDEEWEAEFRPKFEQIVPDAVAAARDGPSKGPRLDSNSTALPNGNKEKAATVGGATISTDAEPVGHVGPAIPASLPGPRIESSHGKASQYASASPATITLTSAQQKENHGYMVDGTALPDLDED